MLWHDNIGVIKMDFYVKPLLNLISLEKIIWLGQIQGR